MNPRNYSRPTIAFFALIILVLIDMKLSTWQLSKVSPMMVFPSLLFSLITAFDNHQPKVSRLLCGLITILGVVVIVAILNIHT